MSTSHPHLPDALAAELATLGRAPAWARDATLQLLADDDYATLERHGLVGRSPDGQVWLTTGP